ncbi:MAG: LacI family DNA-binding transcriptional regulator [Anaerolineae bacterium]|nr:LacI family transcriptional regulator [Anaerolineae bacterium]MDW8100404.1 LacI family DNA-binding transcriptional regulator [Anaerolineae bacterium]
MGVSIKDIAKVAEVSHSTVSRALRDSPLISDETKARIQRIAQEMGYSPSAIARSLVTKRTQTLGLVVTSIADPFVAEIVRGIEERALDEGYSVILCQSQADPEREIAAVEILREKRVDAIIVTASRVGSLYLPLLEKLAVPIVLVNNQQEGRYVHSVGTDNVQGGRLAAHYLLALGHTRIGYITGPEWAAASRQRLEGARQALQGQGLDLDPALIAQGDGRAEGGEEAMAHLLSHPTPPTAVFCYNDMTAIGAMRAVQRAGLRVPEDISIIGYDDVALAAYVTPPLTTIKQRKYEMGFWATEIALALLNGEETIENILVPGELVVRESCASPSEEYLLRHA